MNACLKTCGNSPAPYTEIRTIPPAKKRRRTPLLLRRMIAVALALCALAVTSQCLQARKQEDELARMRSRLEVVETRTAEMRERLSLPPI